MIPPTLTQVSLRLALAIIAGLIVGLERESHGRAAGLRTTILVCVSSTMAMVLSEHLFAGSLAVGGTWRPDPARLAAGVLTGMGFLGAGSIIRQENVVRGVTTAAALWFVSVLGLAFGSGCIALGLMGLFIAVITLYIFPRLEELVQNDWYATLSITARLEGADENAIGEKLEALGIKIKAIHPEYALDLKLKTFRYDIKFKKNDVCDLAQQAVRQLKNCPEVVNIKWN